MKFPENIKQLLALEIDYIGFIFYKKSKRYLDNVPETIDYKSTKKVGVFVNATKKEILEKVTKFNLDYIQLHGNESHNFCKSLFEKGCKIIKAFSVDDDFDFSICEKYVAVTDLFLFDTKGENPGGNGQVFNWEKMTSYKISKPFLLSGGISPNHVKVIQNFYHKQCVGIDVNSGFEDFPGLKNIKRLKRFIDEIRS